MKKILIIIAILCCIPATDGLAKKKKNTTRNIAENPGIQYLDASFGTYDKLQKQIWNLHEMGFQEFKTSALLQQHLRENGFEVEAGVADMPTAFIARYMNGGPVIGLLAEYDALPGLSQDTVSVRKPLVEGDSGHGCGHNLIGTGSAAGAVAIKKWIEATGTKASIIVFGTPAEEGGSGKAYMARAGLFDQVNITLEWHPGQKSYVYVDPWLDMVSIDYCFHGVSAHAAAHPDRGRSAFSAAESFCYMLALMRPHLTPGCMIQYAIDKTGAPNVVPDFTAVHVHIRGRSTNDVRGMMEWVTQASEGAAMGTQTSVTHEIISSTKSKLHNRTLAKLLQEKMEIVGLPKWDERETQFGKEIWETQSKARPFESIYSIVPLADEMQYGSGSSSDVGDVTWCVPDAGFEVQTFIPGTSGHSWQNVAVAGSTIGTKGLIIAAKIFLLSFVELVEKPELIKQAREEFESRRGPGYKYESLIGDRRPPYDYRK